MKAARWRLIVTAVLFAAWLSYLLFLAIWTTHPVVHLWPFQVAKTPAVVLSRPQFLAATLVVIADVQADAPGVPNAEVEVLEVLWPPNAPVQPHQRVTVTNLPGPTQPEGWKGPGPYILPLVRDPHGPGGMAYKVAAIPPSPGFNGEKAPIYPATPETRQQLEQIPKRGE